ncbi:glycoside hydrolase family 53 protein [Kribbella italica]|uniref:Arabinogalactan endo-beta-1,4-galactanase n=1 Tax=Kribbella italica TaxID=1540520 RepID=A0A7W9MU21_9ACTN|nr:glycosyl hydrolase 53 family protein [Kribbella italica]MBB5835787.1 arabinogalactan endo-1,4-beta-galactosidase [Kribbella italica]
MKILTVLTLTTGLIVAATGTASAQRGSVANGGFEQGLRGWSVSGPAGTAKIETAGRTGNRLTHWSGKRYRVTTRQTVKLPDRGWWTVSSWGISGGALNSSTLSVSGCGATASTVIPATGAWVRSAVSVYAGGPKRCTVTLTTAGPAGTWASFDDIGVAPGRVARTIRGGDLSGLAKNEDFGATYRSADGRSGDAVKILARSGMNLGRLKVWVDPADGYNDQAHVVATAQRIKAAGMKLLVDFHYSDRWTDPGAQGVPAAWHGMTPQQLAGAVHQHTREVLLALKAAGVKADMVQVGNEINPGMLWPWGQTWDVDPDDGVPGAQWDNLASFLTAGARAVKEVDPRTQVLLHLTNINNGIDSLTWWFDQAVAREVPFDLIGLSYYGYWHGTLADLQNAVTTLSARYDKDVLNVETAYPFTLADDSPAYENVIDVPSELVAGYPATPAGQAAQFRAVQNAVASAEGGRGIGTVYWEPAWTAVAGAGWDPSDPASGNAWENQAVFDFTGRLLPAARNFAPDPR